jgi:hypothetical protein
MRAQGARSRIGNRVDRADQFGGETFLCARPVQSEVVQYIASRKKTNGLADKNV